MINDPWQCPVCGTVYAWWVSHCREKHEPNVNAIKRLAVLDAIQEGRVAPIAGSERSKYGERHSEEEERFGRGTN